MQTLTTQQTRSARALVIAALLSTAASLAPSLASANAGLSDILAAQDEATQARYAHRHPQETLEFFGVEPGMTVIEALPGGGWYSKILLPLLGSEGLLIGANYALDLWPNFPFADEAYLARQTSWTTTWPQTASQWVAGGAPVEAINFGDLSDARHGTADAVIFVRALHNMARFSDKDDYLGEALADAYAALKPGGIVGIVQHEARPDMPDAWANGSAGYLKKSYVIERMTAAGFELVGDSDVNNNPADQPTTDDIVWRLPPSLGTSADDPEKQAPYLAIGESNRMTLKFKKPSA